MSLQTVRFRTDNDTDAEVRSQRAKVFAAVREASLQGAVSTAYASESAPDFDPARLRDLIGRSAGAPVPPERFVVVGACNS
ncbi:hypothetical protein OG322_24520 [Streptomyces sp. NBC_01260]|uniref:hypothetical protein n=1 Tax=unclassified Streptomyces TaxID=2593676 RepID=UPI000F554401|nr:MULTISPECIES: hypothetical protein [unclassified Streptomyces]MCX4772456.1 hypothetical protein [Streptomyces sp. NBC_01285]ROQ71573.1 hypothetical protein EDD95_7689 [Streptomyces sp. CEV 2-1]RPK50828.1 hypothetical protein EES39_05275 [Streptomyces sp. ADI92-24]